MCEHFYFRSLHAHRKIEEKPIRDLRKYPFKSSVCVYMWFTAVFLFDPQLWTLYTI